MFMNKKIIFIDWDGTLSSSRFWGELRETNNNFAKIVNDFFIFEKKIVIDWMKGLLTSEYINKIISQKSGISEDKLWKIFISDCQNMIIDPHAINLIQNIRVKYPVILVTGNMDCFTRFTIPALKLNDKFDLIVNSADVGYLKTDYNGKCFMDCAKQFNIKSMSNAYLIEDSVKTCETFSRLGGNALKVSNLNETLSHLKLLLIGDTTIPVDLISPKAKKKYFIKTSWHTA